MKGTLANDRLRRWIADSAGHLDREAALQKLELRVER